jgi:FdhD protein
MKRPIHKMNKHPDTEIELREFPAIRVTGDRVTMVRDTICTEEAARLYLNDCFLTELVVSPVQLKELGVGFVICEGLASEVDTVHVAGNEIRVSARVDAMPGWVLESGGGLRAKKPPREVTSSLTIEPEDASRMIREIQSGAWKKTGAVHCSALFFEGERAVRSCDVGRHNTVDKVVGFAVLNGIDLSSCVIACSGRQPAGMVSKVANAGIPIVMSKAAATDQGILTAQQAGVTLVCFARGDRFTIYTHPQRIKGISQRVQG